MCFIDNDDDVDDYQMQCSFEIETVVNNLRYNDINEMNLESFIIVGFERYTG